MTAATDTYRTVPGPGRGTDPSSVRHIHFGETVVQGLWTRHRLIEKRVGSFLPSHGRMYIPEPRLDSSRDPSPLTSRPKSVLRLSLTLRSVPSNEAVRTES